jgi:phage-related protein
VAKELRFVGSSRGDLAALPDEVKDVFGKALLDVQFGDKPFGARAFSEGIPADVLKLVDDFDGRTFRVAYTVVLEKCVYVLHAFEKKSTRGRATPKKDLALVKRRLRAARLDYEASFP